MKNPTTNSADFTAATYGSTRLRGPADPVLVPAEQAFKMLGIGRTYGYRLIADGHLSAKKIGVRTLVEMTSLRAYVAALPFARRSPVVEAFWRARREMLAAFSRFAGSHPAPQEVDQELEATISVLKQLAAVHALDGAAR